MLTGNDRERAWDLWVKEHPGQPPRNAEELTAWAAQRGIVSPPSAPPNDPALVKRFPVFKPAVIWDEANKPVRMDDKFDE